MPSKALTPSDGFDPSQFRLQADGSFRISIRGMAAMAGIDDGALSRSLKSAAAENPLPCSRSLLAEGFCPAAVSTWGETGGIPEDAAPFILEYYGIKAANPSTQARVVLLAFSRVGINAYLKERLGLGTPPVSKAPSLTGSILGMVDESINLLERLGGVDERAQMLLRDVVLNTTLSAAGGSAPQLAVPEELTLSEYLQELGCPSHKATKIATNNGKELKRVYRDQNGRDPKSQVQFVGGRRCQVALYERSWLAQMEAELQEMISKAMQDS